MARLVIHVREMLLKAFCQEGFEREQREWGKRQGRFHVYPITHVDQGLELLTGVPAGDIMTAGTVYPLVKAQV